MSTDESDASTLRQEVRELRRQLTTTNEQFSSVLILESIIRSLDAHCIPDKTTQSLTSRYYAIEPSTGEMRALPSNLESVVDFLWWGRIRSHTFAFPEDDTSVVLTLHPSAVRDDKPLPIVRFPNNQEWPVLRRTDERTHSFMCKLQPEHPGLKLSADTLNAWFSHADFRRAKACVTLWPGHVLLESLVAKWLGRPVRSPALATLLVDVDGLRRFLCEWSSNPTAACHLWCTGQSVVHAYLCLTASNGLQSDICRIPIGTVE